jgi:hypothetical protein
MAVWGRDELASGEMCNQLRDRLADRRLRPFCRVRSSRQRVGALQAGVLGSSWRAATTLLDSVGRECVAQSRERQSSL